MKPCYDVPRMLRELADDIEESGDCNMLAVACRRFDSETLESSIDVRGFGQFASLTETMLLLIDGVRSMAEMTAGEDETDDGCDDVETYE